jgi:ferritin
MRLKAPPEKRKEIEQQVARMRSVKDYPPVEEFIDAYVSERLGDPQLMNGYLAQCRKARLRRSK